MYNKVRINITCNKVFTTMPVFNILKNPFEYEIKTISGLTCKYVVIK